MASAVAAVPKASARLSNVSPGRDPPPTVARVVNTSAPTAGAIDSRPARELFDRGRDHPPDGDAPFRILAQVASGSEATRALGFPDAAKVLSLVPSSPLLLDANSSITPVAGPTDSSLEDSVVGRVAWFARVR